MSAQDRISTEPTNTSIDDLSPERLRAVMGQFCSGVVVVTALGDEPLGFTCQSFVSLSLDPPLVSFCPSRTSTTWPRIRETGRFCVNVLADGHADVSGAFARRGTDKFAGVDWAPTRSGTPAIAGVGAWVDCTLWDEYDGGDHTIVVGRVEQVHADPETRPLVFYRGAYGLPEQAR